ncbi:MAG: hypothetical protein BMS9Abin13_494 [Patescibacteria group bacterium]|nr:MAG: hypothetical protein BMS9Abin13_494 [Patescibacteria group bacterium]
MNNNERGHRLLTFEYNRITPQVFLGTTMCCQAHFSKELLEKGVSADISLQEEYIDAPRGVEAFLWIPVEDGTSPTQDQLDLGVATIDELVSKGKKVYIHCKFGHGRGPMLLAAYLIRKGSGVKEALASIKEKRSVIHLNNAQFGALKEFEKRYVDIARERPAQE